MRSLLDWKLDCRTSATPSLHGTLRDRDSGRRPSRIGFGFGVIFYQKIKIKKGTTKKKKNMQHATFSTNSLMNSFKLQR